jgi:prepilin-type N-terminal cleavage/methylation domain-containing protein
MSVLQQNGERSAFTLIELLVVVLILGALAFVGVPRIGQSQTTAKVNACDTNVMMINRQSEFFFHDTGAWPQNWNKFKVETDYFPDGVPACPFGTNYSMDSGTHHVNAHSH